MDDRFNVVTYSGERIAYRVSRRAVVRIQDVQGSLTRAEPAPRPRFRIEVGVLTPKVRVVLIDHARPAFFGTYGSLELACRAMDNIVRRERGAPERIAVTRREIRERISA